MILTCHLNFFVFFVYAYPCVLFSWTGNPPHGAGGGGTLPSLLISYFDSTFRFDRLSHYLLILLFLTFGYQFFFVFATPCHLSS
jgi:hypothetical protein